MVEILELKNCCGCSACVQACPKRCIRFDEDSMGFRYPIVDKQQCIDCGICERVCPCLNPTNGVEPLCAFTATNPNLYERISSSSGGIFVMLAKIVLQKKGVVFGARFDDNWEVVHSFIKDEKDLPLLMGSKYVQSSIGNSFKQVKIFLCEGKEVLFSGTPCQVAGLKNYLREQYDNLLTVEVVCHGVPSPRVWRSYLKDKFDVSQISHISFRDKSTGWLDFSLKIEQNGKQTFVEPMSRNIYMKAFLRDLSLRPSCYNCPSKSGKSHADIALADFWGHQLINPSEFDNMGTSLVLAYTDKGKNLISNLGCAEKADLQYAKKFNTAINCSVYKNEYVELFWREFINHGFKNIHRVTSKFDISFIVRLKGWGRRIISRLLK